MNTGCFIMNQFSIMYFLILAAVPVEPFQHQSNWPCLPLYPGSSTTRHCLLCGSPSEWGKFFSDRRWMEGEEFSKIYFCLNPIHLLGTRQGKLFPWHRVCLWGRVGPSGALSLLPVLLRINGSTWSPNPPLHPVPFCFPFLCFPFSLLLFLPFFFSPPLSVSPLPRKWQLLACRDYVLSSMWDKQFTQERLVKTLTTVWACFCCFVKCVNFMTLKPAVKAKPRLISQWCEVSGKE